MKKFLILLIALIFLTPTTSFANEKKKVGYVSLTYETKDNFIIKSKLFYPTTKQKVYPIVVFLHSLGYSSEYWGNLTKEFVDAGYAALVIDLRGHGESIYDSNFKIQSWLYYTEKNYVKFADDIEEILKYVALNYKNISPTNYIMVGADVGANTAILTAEKMPNKPKCLVLMSPSKNFKGIYTPIALANIGKIPILVMVSQNDRYFVSEAIGLERFAQGSYIIKKYPVGGTGMMMLKANPTMTSDIVKWVQIQAPAMPVEDALKKLQESGNTKDFAKNN